MWMYLTYIGRFAGHVFRLTIMPLALCLFFAAIDLTDRKGKNEKIGAQQVVYSVIMSGIIALCIAITLVINVYIEYTAFLSRQDQFLEEQKYVSTHPNELLVSARSYTPVKFNSIYQYGNNRSNLFYKVDFLMFSDAYQEKLRVNGLEKLDIDSFFTEKNIYYIGDTENDRTLNKLLVYMKTQYGETVRTVEHERLDYGVSVFEFKIG